MGNLKFDVVLTTSDYSMFKKLKGNRPLDELKVKRFMVMFKIRQLPWYVIINEKGEVIEGQHRLEACKRLGIPVPYMIKFGYGLKEAHEYNEVGSPWTKNEFVHGYAELGVQSYIWLEEFMEVYPDFKTGAAEIILTNTPDGAAKKDMSITNAKGKNTGKTLGIKKGGLNITLVDKQRGYENAAKIMEYKQYFDKFNHTTFIKTMISLFKNPKFDNDRMIERISVQQTKFVQCSSIKLYKLLMQDIYNFNCKKVENRLPLYP